MVIGGLMSGRLRGLGDEGALAGRHPDPRLDAFKTTSKSLTKTNLLVFLTPRIVRTPAGSRARRRSATPRGVPRQASGRALELSEEQLERRGRPGWPTAERRPDLPYRPDRLRERRSAVAPSWATRRATRVERMREIELTRIADRELTSEAGTPRGFSNPPSNTWLLAAIFGDADAAAALLTDLIDSGTRRDAQLGAEAGGSGDLRDPPRSLREPRGGPVDVGGRRASLARAGGLRPRSRFSRRTVEERGFTQ